METTQTLHAQLTTTLADVLDERTLLVVRTLGGTWVPDPEVEDTYAWTPEQHGNAKSKMAVILYLAGPHNSRPYDDAECDDLWMLELHREALLQKCGPCTAVPSQTYYGKRQTEACTLHHGHTGCHVSPASDGTLTGWTRTETGLRFTTKQYVRNTGKQPRGTGYWAFVQCTAETAFANETFGEERAFYGTLTEAKALLRADGALGLWAVCS